MALDLQGLRILISRPEKFAQNLIAQLRSLHASLEVIPLFSIESMLDAASAKQLEHKMRSAELLIFVSPTVAEIASQYLEIAKYKICACLSAASARHLQSFGLENLIYPKDLPFNSSSLISILLDLGLNSHKILVLKGEGGMPWPSNYDQLTLYRRLARPVDELPQVDLILISCTTSLCSLSVFNIPLLVVSDRIRTKALNMGFTRVYLAKGMSDKAIVDAILNLQAKNLIGEKCGLV